MRKSKLKILEVGLRDGIQNEKKNFSVNDRFYILKKLLKSGLTRIEVGSFVSAKAVPQMKLSKELVKKINKEIKLKPDQQLFALVPNEQGFHTALDLGIKNISVIASSTEAFAQKNTNVSIKSSLKRIENICKLARRHKIKVRGYLSMAFGCPYEGLVSEAKVIRLTRSIMENDLTEIAISDTIGVASPLQVKSLIQKIEKYLPVSKLSLHCHNTRGMALPNILQGLECGIRSFDSSIGGLGGCPYANGSSGNVSTEDLIVLLEGMNLNTNIDISELVKLAQWMKQNKKVQLSSHTHKLSKQFHLYKFKKY